MNMYKITNAGIDTKEQSRDVPRVVPLVTVSPLCVDYVQKLLNIMLRFQWAFDFLLFDTPVEPWETLFTFIDYWTGLLRQ